MKCLLRLTVVLALVLGGWFWWGGRLKEASFSHVPPFVQHVVSSVLTIENTMRHRVQMIESGATMMKEGKVMMEKGIRGNK